MSDLARTRRPHAAASPRDHRPPCGRAVVLAAAAVLSSACGGGGGGGSSISVGFTSSGSSAPEGTSAAVVLELRTGGAALAEDVSVILSDAGTGNATSGADYSALAPLTVSFPAGSAHLDTFTVLLDLLDDSLVEGADEAVELTLAPGGEGVKIRGAGTHTLTVQEGDLATIGFLGGSTTTPDEGDATYTAPIQLGLDPGDVLGLDVAVVVGDAGTGTATSGVDYAPFAAQTIGFPAGSADGSSVDVQITVQDDTDAEPHETAVLGLSAASEGVLLGANDRHVLTITEDDASPDPFLDPRADDAPGGMLVALASGEAREFGARTLDSGAGDRVRLELTNAGLQPLTVTPLQLTGDTRDFRIETQVGALPPPAGLGVGVSGEGASVAPLPLEGGALAAPIGQAYAFDPDLAAALATETALLLDGLVTPEGEVLTLEVSARRLPLAPDAVLAVDGVVRPGALEEALAGVSAWSGTVLDHPGSEVFLGLAPSGLQGWVRFGAEQDHRTLQLLPVQGGQAVVVTEDVDAAVLSSTGGPVGCLAEVVSPDGLPRDLLQLGAGGEPGTGELDFGVGFSTARLAVETDYHYFALFGDEVAATAYATQLIAAVAEAYERDVQVTLAIAYLGIYTTPSDPWAAGDASGDDTLDLLDEFQTTWSSGGWPADADLAHFVSGARLGGGIAYLDVLCSQVYGFGVSANIGGNIDWGTFSGSSSSLTWDFVVVAHELGHNFGARHTHDYCPPLDACASNCTGNSNCSRSTLMSYCHTCGGMSNIDLRFHPYNADLMRDEVGKSCLDDASLEPGATVTFDLRFDPVSGAGAKAATLSFGHDAVNAASPFTLELTGTAQN